MCDACNVAWDNMWNSMLLSTTWAEGYVVRAAAWYLTTDIWVTTERNTRRSPWTKIPAYSNGRPSRDEQTTIRMLNIRQTHFQSLHHRLEIPRPAQPQSGLSRPQAHRAANFHVGPSTRAAYRPHNNFTSAAGRVMSYFRP